MANENTLLLTLPNVTLSDETGGGAVEETEVTGKTFLGQHESVVGGDLEYSGGDNDQYSCHQHITSTLKRERGLPGKDTIYSMHT